MKTLFGHPRPEPPVSIETAHMTVFFSIWSDVTPIWHPLLDDSEECAGEA